MYKVMILNMAFKSHMCIKNILYSTLLFDFAKRLDYACFRLKLSCSSL